MKNTVSVCVCGGAGQFSVPWCRSSRFLLHKLKGGWIIWFGCVLDGHGEFASHSGGSHFLCRWRLLQQRDHWRRTDRRVFCSSPILTRYHFWPDMCVFPICFLLIFAFANWTLSWLRTQTGSNNNREVFQIIYLKIKCENWKNEHLHYQIGAISNVQCVIIASCVSLPDLHWRSCWSVWQISGAPFIKTGSFINIAFMS